MKDLQQFKKKWEEKLIYADNREMLNDILDEAKKEVERHRMSGAEFSGGRIMVEYSDISTLIEKLKVTPDTCSGSGGTKEKYLRP